MLSSRDLRVVLVSVLAGCVSGAVLLALNFAVMQHFTDQFANIELDSQQSAAALDEDQFDSYLQSILAWQIIGPFLVGPACGAIFGLVHIYMQRYRLELKKEVAVIAALTWFVLYAIPAIKYPPDPPTVDQNFLSFYQMLFAAYMALSAFAAIGVAVLFRRVRTEGRIFAAAAVYLVIISVAHFVLPDDPTDLSYVPSAFMGGFRTATTAVVIVFWVALAAISGMFWKRYLATEKEFRASSRNI